MKNIKLLDWVAGIMMLGAAIVAVSGSSSSTMKFQVGEVSFIMASIYFAFRSRHLLVIMAIGAILASVSLLIRTF